MRIIVQSRHLFTSATVRGKNAYSNTLLLPKTPFELRARAATREHLFRDRCTKDLYPWQLENNPKDLFILHDGPPYANGDVHSGHAMNKILKDIVNRYKILQGHKVWYRPGWDCHGLPIELKALEEIREKGKELTAVEIRALAKRRAQREIEKQKKAFMSWAVLGDWDNPYLTMTRDYEIRQLRVFRDMMKKGYIYRQLKPVYWSPSSRSALAESELEYNEHHISRAIHVRFPISSKTPALEKIPNLYAVIWTTTPWTIPANRAIAVNPELRYSVVMAGQDHYFVATDRVDAFRQDIGYSEPMETVHECLGAELVGSTYRHILTNAESPIIAGAHVTSESGTGLVHTAPDHGMEDYEVCQALGIKPFGPVDDQGRYTKEVGEKLAGLDAFTTGTAAVIDALKESNAILKEEQYAHKYPYDWRTKKPVMLRATAQWFANVEDLQKTAVEALKSVRMVPEVSIRRLEQFTLSRKEWCISRQRAWGVPIPALYDVDTGEALLTDASVEHIIRVFEERGTDTWWEEPDDAVFVAPQYRNNGRTYRRGYDTMDVWFDSGTSWTMIKERDSTKPVADVYLEGSDQHRGWFQSSLLTSIALTGKTPYSTLITHGFALDEQGRKMSKSLGNTIVPSLIIEGGKDKKLYPAYGTDVLRMWVANCEYTRDVSIGPSITAQISEHMRKIRTTARFLLGNLFDFHHTEQVPYSRLKEIDRYMLHELTEFADRVTAAFDSFAYNKAMHHIQNFTTNDLSAFYFDVIKDRLYYERQAGLARRSAQTVLYHILRAYTTALAPVACHTAEEIYENYRNITPKPESSVFKLGWFAMEQAWRQQGLQEKWTLLKQLKGHVNQVLEAARQEKTIRSSNEANVDIAVDPSTKIGQLIHAMDPADLSELFVTSKVTLHSHDTSISMYRREAELEGTSCIIAAQPSLGHKCPRCWCYHSVEPDTLCARCTNVLH